jgi:O-antigen/teichoic acid export membrane protein
MVLSAGVASSGALTYAYFALASHHLDADRYGNLVVLWSVLFVSVFTLYRPIEQLVSRTVAERGATGAASGDALRVALTIQAAIVVVFVTATLLLRPEIEDDLLGGDSALFHVFLISGPAYAASFLARGYLAGSGRFALYGAMLLLESTSRIIPAILVAVGLASGASTVAAGIAIAPLMSLTVVPAVALSRRGPRPPARAAPTGDRLSLPHGTRFVAAAFLIALSEQTLLNAGVIVVNSTAGSADAGLLFNVLLLARAPQVLFVAVTTSLLPSLSRLRVQGDEGARQFAAQIRTTVLALAAAAALVAAVVLIAGPELMQLTFGDRFGYPRAGLLIVVAGMLFHLSSLTLTQGALAQRRAGYAAACWVGSAVLFVAWAVVPALDEVRRVEVGYAACTLLLALSLLPFRHLRHHSG